MFYAQNNYLSDYTSSWVWFVINEYLMAIINVYRSLLPSDRVIGWDMKMTSHPNSNASFINIWDPLIWRRSPNLMRLSKLAAAPNCPALVKQLVNTSTDYWCMASKLKALQIYFEWIWSSWVWVYLPNQEVIQRQMWELHNRVPTTDGFTTDCFTTWWGACVSGRIQCWYMKYELNLPSPSSSLRKSNNTIRVP